MRISLRHIVTLAAAALGSLGASAPAQQSLPTPQAVQQEKLLPVPAQQIARPALWKVADGDTTIYLFGTVHALPKGLSWFDGRIASAFDGSQELVTEIIETDPAQMQSLVVSKAMLPKGQTLRALLSPADRTAYENAMRQNGLPPETFDPFEPWYAAIGLATLPLMREGYASENGVEGVLDARAKALGHPHSALETAEYQLGLFDSLPLDVQKTYLHEVIDSMPKLKEELAAMIAAWSSGDAEKLAALMNEDEDDPLMLEKLLYDRNKTWAGWIKARLGKPGTVFVAVGAGHLAGAGSVQDQLAAQGISASRVQ